MKVDKLTMLVSEAQEISTASAKKVWAVETNRAQLQQKSAKDGQDRAGSELA